MHPLVELQTFQTFAAKSFERTARIHDVVAGHPVTEGVGDAGGKALPPPILPAVANTANGVPVGQHLDEARNVDWVILQVPVERHDGRALGQMETRRQGRRLAQIALETRHADAGIGLLGALEFVRRPVPTAVVHKEEFERPGPSRECSAQFLNQRGDVSRFVKDRNNDTERAISHRLRGLSGFTGRRQAFEPLPGRFILARLRTIAARLIPLESLVSRTCEQGLVRRVKHPE